jgi:hypothetical protein
MKKVLLSVAFLLIISVFGAYCQQNSLKIEFTTINVPDSVVFGFTASDLKGVEVYLVSDEQSFKGEAELVQTGFTMQANGLAVIISVTATNFDIPNGLVVKKIKIILTYWIRSNPTLYYDVTLYYDIEKKTWD